MGLRRFWGGLALFALVAAGCGSASSIAGDRVLSRRAVVTDGAAPAADVAPAVGAPSGEAPEATPVPLRDHALLIGIDHAHGTPALQGAVRDATTIRDALHTYGYPQQNLTLLTEQQATKHAILGAITELAARSTPQSRTVFAFAGHTRRRGGQNQIVTADGRMLPARQLAAALGAVRGPMWIALPTCYAAGFAIPGIVGPGRVVTFASSADRPSYEATWFGRSFLVQFMVLEAMLHGRASGSVERAFAYAHREIEQYGEADLMPLIDDRHPGEFVLGQPIPPKPTASREPASDPRRSGATPPPSSPPEPQPPDPPAAPPSHDRPADGPAEICGPYVRIDCKAP